MQEIRSSSPPVVTGICDPNKSRARHHRSLKLGSKLYLNINRLFVLSFKNGNDDPMRDSFDNYYIPLGEIKDFNALIDNKPFLIGP